MLCIYTVGRVCRENGSSNFVHLCYFLLYETTLLIKIKFSRIQFHSLQRNKYITLQSVVHFRYLQCNQYSPWSPQNPHFTRLIHRLWLGRLKCKEMQCSVVQCSVVQCRAVQFSAVQCSVVKQYGKVQCSVIRCSTEKFAVLCNTVLYNSRQVEDWSQ